MQVSYIGIVLIPFISGLDCYRFSAPQAPDHRGLNPFYFRAGLLPTVDEGKAPKSVLIPFISGLDCYPRQNELISKGAGAI